MTNAVRMPGVRFEIQPPPSPPSPLRSDVAGFAGRTVRGPVGMARRVEGWRAFMREFGGLDKDAVLPLAVRGYFENGGQVAWIARVGEPDARTYERIWWTEAREEKFVSARYRLSASSPGDWARNLRVTIRFRLAGPGGQPTVDMTIRAPGESTEYLRGLNPASSGQFEGRINRESILLRVAPVHSEDPLPKEAKRSGSGQTLWESLSLAKPAADQEGASGSGDASQRYREAVASLNAQPEVAIVALPALHDDLASDANSTSSPDQSALELYREASAVAASLQDRVVLVDTPPQLDGAPELTEYAETLRQLLEVGKTRRAAAVYHPRILVDDPYGDRQRPFRLVSPTGHVAGVLSRVDRNRGAHHTPANVPLLDAVDLATSYADAEGGALYEHGVNLLTCKPGRGLMVWGGRTLDGDRDGVFLAHRRFLHRLVRAIRQVAEPLVFENNQTRLRQRIVRALTSVLLGAFRSGAFQGDRPEQAFFVRCDDTTNAPHLRAEGLVQCEIGVAMAAPMEFITLRLAVSRTGQLEVFDA